jgi:sec-independent protein translocase protein TatA
MFGLGTMEILVILGIGLLLFGKRLPEMGGQFARGIRSFQQGLRGVEDDVISSVIGPAQPQLPPQRMPPPRFDQGNSPTPPV